MSRLYASASALIDMGVQMTPSMALTLKEDSEINEALAVHQSLLDIDTLVFKDGVNRLLVAQKKKELEKFCEMLQDIVGGRIRNRDPSWANVAHDSASGDLIVKIECNYLPNVSIGEITARGIDSGLFKTDLCEADVVKSGKTLYFTI